jgi:transposase
MEQIASKNEGVLCELPKVKRKVSKKHKLPFNLTAYLKEIQEVDVTEIFGISELSALTIMSEIGLDLSKWKNEHHFTSWLGLAPNTKISGGKVISSRIMKKKHHAGQAFRMAANGLHNSKSPLGDYYRRIKSKAGAGKAVVATARKLAIIYYKVVSKKESFNPKALEDYHEKYKQKKINQLKRKLELLGAA